MRSRLEETLDILKEFHSNPKLKMLVENFICENDFNPNEIPPEHNRYSFEDSIINKFYEFRDSLCRDFDIKRENINLYFSLDMQLFIKLHPDETYNFDMYFSIPLDNSTKMELNAHTLSQAYN